VPTLEVPPDLTSPTRDDRYAVPDTGGKGRPLSRRTPPSVRRRRGHSRRAKSCPEVDQARIERSGNQRWLVATGAPDKLWGPVKDFWQETGFVIKLELPDAGVMETDWAENRAKIEQDFIRNLLGKVIDSVYSTAERDKFRTRLEPGSTPGTTDIFISHRGMYEIYVSEGKDQTKWQPRPADPELEAEMLRRLMIRLGSEEKRAATAAIQAAQEKPVERAQADARCRRGRYPRGRGIVRSRLASSRSGAGPCGFHGRRPGSFQGPVLRSLCRPRKRQPEEGRHLLVELNPFKGSSADKVQIQYRIFVREAGSLSTVQVLSPRVVLPVRYGEEDSQSALRPVEVIRFASLGSGSQGNALIVDAGETKVLLDCGFLGTHGGSQRLARLGTAPDELTAIVVTHEHADHVEGVFAFARRHQLTVYLTHGTHAAASAGQDCLARMPADRRSHAFAIGGLEVQPFPVPHDAREPVQYAFSDGQQQCLGVLTDSGSITPHIVEVLGACDGLVLECNHDQALLAASRYPARLKQRIGGRFGHLENDQAADFLRQVDTRRLQHVLAAHLSQENNRPELAARALASRWAAARTGSVSPTRKAASAGGSWSERCVSFPGNEKAGLRRLFHCLERTDRLLLHCVFGCVGSTLGSSTSNFLGLVCGGFGGLGGFGGFGGIGGRSSSRSSSRSGSRGSRRSGRSSGGRRSGRSSSRFGFFLLATSGNGQSDQRSNEERIFHNGVPYRQWNDYNEPKA
jgi:outer membrane protein assembly factor BamC